MLTNAQNFEDVILQRLFEEKDAGFYVDIGACDPDYLSVTRHFYDRGWSGVNVEPIESQWNKFNQSRPRDVNVHAAISGSAGTVILTQVKDNLALSSTTPGWRFATQDTAESYFQTEVKAITSNQLFEIYVPVEVDFLKIDAEGAEADILFSLDLQKYRPKVIVIEAVKPLGNFPGWEKFNLSEVANWDKWQPYLLANGYVEAYFDGLNKFFLRDDMVHLAARLELPVGVFDNIIPDVYAHANVAAVEKEAVITSSNAQIARLGEVEAELRSKLMEIAAENSRLFHLLDDSRDKSTADLARALHDGQSEIEVLKRSVEQQLRFVAAKQLELTAMHSSIERLNNVIEQKDDAFAAKQVELIDKETVIICLTKALTAYRVAHLALSGVDFATAGQIDAPSAPTMRQSLSTFGKPRRALSAWRHSKIVYRLKSILRPRLGNLNQYAPRKLNLPPLKQAVALSHYPKISVVTPSYGQGSFIERTLRSVLDQAYPNLEYFVQDGGSVDATTDVLKAYEARLAGWSSERDSGQSQAINRGFAHTSGDIMAWLNSDDLLLPGTLACVAEYFDRHPDIDVVYGDRLLIDENDMEIGRWILPKHEDGVLDWVDYVPQETMFWRRRIWEKVEGRVDESFRFAMDWDLLVRFKEAGARFAHMPRFMGAFRIHARQKTSAAIHEVGHEEMTRIRLKQLGSVPSHTDIAKAIFPYMLRHLVVDMIYRVKSRLRLRL